MQEFLFIVYYLYLLFATMLGLISMKHLDKPMKVLVVLLCMTSISEFLAYTFYKMAYYSLRPIVYHISAIIEIILITRFFIFLIQPSKSSLYNKVTVLFWIAAGVLNILFLQPLDNINSNISVLESFCIITMSLYYIYWVIKKGFVVKLYKIPHFWIAIIWLTFWSTTFFYWAFIKILYGRSWEYINLISTLQILLNVIVYAAFAAVFYFYPKKQISHENS